MFENIIDNDIYMKCDIYKYDNQYHIEIDLPGFKRDNISVEFKNGCITVLASKKENKEVEEKDCIKRERTFGTDKRDYYVGNVDYSMINAKYRDGVLAIDVVMKNDNDDKKNIEIK